MGDSVGQWVGSCQITKSLINLDLIEIIQFYLKIYDLWRHPHLWVGVWLVEWVCGSMGGVRSNHLLSNKSGLNQDNSILFEDLWFVETPQPMGGWVGGWMDDWVDVWVMLNHLKLNQSWPNWGNSIMDVLDIFWTFLLKPPQPFIGLYILGFGWSVSDLWLIEWHFWHCIGGR